MRRLIIIRGNSGSGKTSVAKALQTKFGPNTMLISHDMIRMQILHVWGNDGIEKSESLMINLLKYGRENSEITILEGILNSKEYNLLYETAVKEYGSNIFAYYYDLPFEETILRHSTKPNRKDFDEEDMRKWWNEKDYLSIISETIFGKEIGLEDAVECIYQQVTVHKNTTAQNE